MATKTLQPLDSWMLSHFPIAEGERVAFREDHPAHPGMYGTVNRIGYQDGVKLQLSVYDPARGLGSEEIAVYLAGMEEIQ